MNVTAEERIMYSVMKAVYDSGIPISFKGSMVLKACLFEAGFLDETRHTVDIDANWNTDTPPTAEQMVESLQRAINRGGMDYEVRLYRMYGEKRSAGFELVDRNTDEILFTMLMCDKVTPQYDRQPPLLFRTKGHSIRRVHDFMLYLKY